MTSALRHEAVASRVPGLIDIGWAWLGAVLGIGLCAWLSSRWFEPRELTLIIGSFGASAVLVYGAAGSPFSQPRNVLGGHVISALAGVASWKLFGDTLWLASAIAVASALALMLASGTVHPPGGATALIAVIGGEQTHALGFAYAAVPVTAGAIVLLAVALVIHKLSRRGTYPERWF